MPIFIPKATRIEAQGNKPKIIEEMVGLVNSKTAQLSIAHMKSPPGWKEPGQRPDFTEYTYVLKGVLHVEFDGGSMDVASGQAIISQPGEWVQYSTPDPQGAEYIAVCLPAFSPQIVHRDA